MVLPVNIKILTEEFFSEKEETVKRTGTFFMDK